jgi:DNA (cytosine-5)-methyltransferase 1
VDGLIGGIPCQPHSLAGKRLGEDDERDLWSAARRIIVQSRPWFVLIENVRGMLSSGGAERVWRDFHRLGFVVEGGLFTASEVGAPHERERIIILAVADCGCHGLDWCAEQDGEPLRSRQSACGRSDVERCNSPLGRELADSQRKRISAGLSAPAGWYGVRSKSTVFDDDSSALVDATGERQREGRAEPEFRSGRVSGGGTDDTMGNAIGGRHHGRPDDSVGREVKRIAAEGSSGTSLFPPGPAELSRWRHSLDIAPQLEPAFRRVADGLASRLDIARVDRLRLLGNGVVSLEGAYAFRTLATRLAASGSVAAKRLIRGMVMTESEMLEAAE